MCTCSEYKCTCKCTCTCTCTLYNRFRFHICKILRDDHETLKH